MKQLTLSKAALRTLVSQLEAKGDGFNIKQLRLLDKTIGKLFEPIREYNGLIEDKITQAKNTVAADPLNQALINATNEKLNNELNAITDAEGKAKVDLLLEDEQYNFIKETIEATQGYRGQENVRRIILEIADSLESVKDATN